MNTRRSFFVSTPGFVVAPGLALVALASTVSVQSAAPGTVRQDEVHTFALYPASKVIGLDLRNDSEKNLGDIGDLLVETHSGEIRYAALDVGGFLGVGEDHRVVPWSLIRIVPDEKDADKCHARTSLTEQQVKAAPKCKAKERIDADLEKRMEASFGKHESWAYEGKGDAALAWCSRMDGALVRDAEGKEVGKVKHVVLAPANDCAAYVVIDTTKDAGDKHVALPWGRVGFSYDGENKLVATTPIEIARFKSAPEYDGKDWKRMSSTAWMNELATYYACDPFWKTPRFATAHPRPTEKQ